MSETGRSRKTARPPTGQRGSPEVTINPLVLHKSQLPFTISLASFLALLLLIFAPV